MDGHTCKIKQDFIKNVLTNKLVEKRPGKKPRQRWMNHIKNNLYGLRNQQEKTQKTEIFRTIWQKLYSDYRYVKQIYIYIYTLYNNNRKNLKNKIIYFTWLYLL